MTLPSRRKKPSLAISHTPERVFQRHRKWLRSHECVCSLNPVFGDGCYGTTEVSHIRTAANAGTGLKPMDSSAVPMCQRHHAIYHNVGHESWQKRFRLDLAKLAAEFAAKSPDTKLREAMKDPS